jgi:hypothetical protein
MDKHSGLNLASSTVTKKRFNNIRHQHGLARTLAVGLQDVDSLDGVQELLLRLLLVVGNPDLQTLFLSV